MQISTRYLQFGKVQVVARYEPHLGSRVLPRFGIVFYILYLHDLMKYNVFGGDDNLYG